MNMKENMKWTREKYKNNHKIKQNIKKNKLKALYKENERRRKNLLFFKWPIY